MERRIRRLYIKATSRLTVSELTKFELLLKTNKKDGLRFLVDNARIIEEEKKELRKYYNL